MARATDHALLGTVVQVEVAAGRFVSAKKLVTAVLAEMRTLEQVFNVFDPSSGIAALRASGQTENPDLTTVLALAQDWQQRTRGLFDPRSGGSLDLNGIAKGWIVDRAAQKSEKASRVVINAGGDILHRGSGSVRVGIEDPARPFDNVEPTTFVMLSNAAIATSGPARRGAHLWAPPDQRDVHVASASASVVAVDAATADALATAFAVAPPKQALEIADQEQVAVRLVTSTGEEQTNDRWAAVETSAS